MSEFHVSDPRSRRNIEEHSTNHHRAAKRYFRKPSLGCEKVMCSLEMPTLFLRPSPPPPTPHPTVFFTQRRTPACAWRSFGWRFSRAIDTVQMPQMPFWGKMENPPVPAVGTASLEFSPRKTKWDPVWSPLWCTLCVLSSRTGRDGGIRRYPK